MSLQNVIANMSQLVEGRPRCHGSSGTATQYLRCFGPCLRERLSFEREDDDIEEK